MLERAGYKVLTAANGEEALRLFEEQADAIDLAVLDVVMPKLSGRAVFDRMREKCPHVRVLFASGYSTNAIHTDFVLDEGLTLLQKPYQRADLLRKVRETLDQE
jgi:CheY-like chemotaxis protein